MTDTKKAISNSSFLFLDETIDLANMGSREGDNSFLLEGNPFLQLKGLLKVFEGFTPIGVCMDDSVSKDYGVNNKYRPVVLENEDGERCWIHIPYEFWKEYLSMEL